jgi:hypothetical protein
VLLQGLVPLVTAASSSSRGGSSDSGTGLLLLLSAWVGLARLAAAAGAGSAPFTAGSQLTGALQTCIQQLLPLLPLLPAAAVAPVSLQQVVAGTPVAEVVQQLMDQRVTVTCWLGAADSSSSSSSEGGSSGSTAGCDQVLLVWKAAVSCLRLLHPDVQLAVTEPSSAAAAAAAAGGSTRELVRAVQLRCLLVLCGNSLGWKDLTGLRNTSLRLLPATSSSSSSSADVTAEQALLPLAVAGATAPQSGVLQQLQQVAAAARLAAAPVNAAILIAATLAAWLAAAGGSSGEAAAAAAAAEQQLVFGSGARGLLQQLSAVLPQLLSFDGISGSRQGFVNAVLGVLRELGTAVAERVSGGAAHGDEELRGCSECVEQLRAALHVVQQGGL